MILSDLFISFHRLAENRFGEMIRLIVSSIILLCLCSMAFTDDDDDYFPEWLRESREKVDHFYLTDFCIPNRKSRGVLIPKLIDFVLPKTFRRVDR